MGESPTKPFLRLTVGHGRRGLEGWVWGWAGEIQTLRVLVGLILRQLPSGCAGSIVRVHTLTGLAFQDPTRQPSALLSTWSPLRPLRRAWSHSCGSTFSFGLGSEWRALELLALATSREAVRGLRGASLDAGLLLFLFQAGRPLHLLSVCSEERSAPDAVGRGWGIKNAPSLCRRAYRPSGS